MFDLFLASFDSDFLMQFSILCFGLGFALSLFISSVVWFVFYIFRVFSDIAK